MKALSCQRDPRQPVSRVGFRHSDGHQFGSCLRWQRELLCPKLSHGGAHRLPVGPTQPHGQQRRARKDGAPRHRRHPYDRVNGSSAIADRRAQRFSSAGLQRSERSEEHNVCETGLEAGDDRDPEDFTRVFMKLYLLNWTDWGGGASTASCHVGPAALVVLRLKHLRPFARQVRLASYPEHGYKPARPLMSALRNKKRPILLCPHPEY